MGVCPSSDKMTPDQQKAARQEKTRSKQLELFMGNDHQTEQQISKLLLLGAGESGKSTLFKQMITIYGKGYPESERRGFALIIYNNIITSMKTILQQCPTYGACQVPDSQRVLEEDIKGDEEIDVTLGTHIKTLWTDSGVQATYEQRANYQLTDSASYFFDRIDEVMQADYIPSEQDVLRSRVRTTGIVENAFDIEGNQFKMFDVGGQRNERKKWIHCFENVTAVLFVAAISEYDQVLYEDENTNRMVEALNLFEEICNSRWFRETAMILFLNKRDLFQIKIQKVSLRVCFQEYEAEDTYEAGCEFLQGKFNSRNRNPDKAVYTHITCATDTDNISAVFNAVKDIIIRKSLTEAGLV
jgi:guanine nucleotide-binding protein G(i) subunit alpha